MREGAARQILSVQAPRAVVMIRPHHFHPNPETMADNSFQTSATAAATLVAARAHDEVTRACESLERAGVRVHLFDDLERETPDSVFPNNWFSTHAGGHVAIYPMFVPNRRKERRWDIIEMLKRTYRVQDVIDYSGLEEDGLALEGTGAMVLDHIGRIAYAAKSNRCSDIALERFCTHFNFEPVVFDAADRHRRLIYHTNVLMCVGTGFALLGADTVVDPTRRREIVARLEETGRVVIVLSHAQVEVFGANALELQGRDGALLALSRRALEALEPAQVALIERHARLLPLDVPTIELAGGSVRCMMAGLHLTPRPAPADQNTGG
ncbi:citrulline utilization hydrolase CtlX [Gluconacetobacter sp. Hr-1-5]|uniref:citrulline utilization hydrolase CtlX n=1 Tax=Gluconacetobacter sp. Hr-1-5 TaxID=3395370 RepID=UPI003B519532